MSNSVVAKVGSERRRQLNLGPFPEPVIDGLDLLAEAEDMSRAQLARRVLTGYVAARLFADAVEREPAA